MKKIIILLVFVFAQLCIFAQNNGHFLKIQINNRSELDTLTRMVSIDNVFGNEVFAYATGEQLEKLSHSHFIFEEFEYVSTDTRAITMATTVEQMANWDRYPTYSVYNQLMANYTTKPQYQNLCKLDTIGTSIQGRNMLVLKVTSDIHNPKPKPEVLFSSTMHGDEVVGWILCLRLADYLLSNYGTNARITSMLDSIAIFIAPNTNPDGTYYSGDNIIGSSPTSRRENKNGVDLNRNFPDPRAGQHPDGKQWQKETIAMMDYAEANHFVLGINYHGGAEVANYPWDTWTISQHKHADHNWYYQISRQYATSVQAVAPSTYFRDNLCSPCTGGDGNGVTHGASWYPITGGRQDYVNYWHNCREITLEVSSNKTPGSETLPNYWNYNKEAMLGYIENVKYGIRGLVTGECGEPIAAKITAVGYDKDHSEVVTNPQFGNYYRMIEPGTYNLLFESEGYESKTITNVTAQQNKTTLLNVTLQSTQSPMPNIEPQIVYFETKATAGDTIITISNKGKSKFNFTATVDDEQNHTWLSLSNNLGVLCTNEKNDILLSFDFTSLQNALYEANVQVEVEGNVTNIPVSILFMGAENEIGIPYVTPKEIVLETIEFTGDCVVTMKNIGNKTFDYYLDLEPEACDAWLYLSHHSGDLEPKDSVEIVLSYNFAPITKKSNDYSATLLINAADTVIQIPVQIKHLLNIFNQTADRLNIYPNPATKEVTITLPNNLGDMFMDIYSITGQKLNSKQLLSGCNKFTLYQLGIKNAGIYFIRVQNGRFVEIKKLVVE